jgi:hypothetical protein
MEGALSRAAGVVMAESKFESRQAGPSLSTWLDLWNLALILVGVTAVLVLFHR